MRQTCINLRPVQIATSILALILIAGSFSPVVAQKTIAQKTIVLVRHAEKVADQSRDPELTDAGRSRAETLADLLVNMNVTHIISSQFKRTMDTAKPAADRSGLELEIIGAGVSEDALAAVVDAVDGQSEGETILIVGHSNTIPRLVHALGGPELPDLEEHEYDSIFIVQRGSAPEGSAKREIKMIRLRYGVPNG